MRRSIKLKINKSINKVYSLIIFFMLFMVTAYAQNDVVEFNVHVENASGRLSKDGAINVICSSSSEEYSYFLYDEEPIGRAKILKQSGKISDMEYRFEDLRQGVYYVCVYDKKNNSSCYKVEIGSN